MHFRAAASSNTIRIVRIERWLGPPSIGHGLINHGPRLAPDHVKHGLRTLNHQYSQQLGLRIDPFGPRRRAITILSRTLTDITRSGSSATSIRENLIVTLWNSMRKPIGRLSALRFAFRLNTPMVRAELVSLCSLGLTNPNLWCDKAPRRGESRIASLKRRVSEPSSIGECPGSILLFRARRRLGKS